MLQLYTWAQQQYYSKTVEQTFFTIALKTDLLKIL